MNRNVLIGLALLTVVVLLSALYLTRPASNAVNDETDLPLVPGLRDAINDVARIEIRSASSEPVSLVRDDSRWRVIQKDNYEADFALVHDLLRDLASGLRAEPRTSNPEWYGRLGVAGIDEPEAGGVEVSFPESDLPGLIIGAAGPVEGTRFVRLDGESQAWLSDRDLDVAAEALGWLERSIMDIPASELSEVTLRHADGEIVQLRPAGEEGSDWVLMNVPDGREAEPMWRLRPVANALAGLQLDDVRRHDQVPEDAARALFVTRDGLNFVASLFEDEQGGWVHFSVTAEVQATEDDTLSDEDAASSADAGAVELTKRPDAMISALLKISGRAEMPKTPSSIMEMCIENPRTGFTALLATHPAIEDRVAALERHAGGRRPPPEKLTLRPSAAELLAREQAAQEKAADGAQAGEANAPPFPPTPWSGLPGMPGSGSGGDGSSNAAPTPWSGDSPWSKGGG